MALVAAAALVVAAAAGVALWQRGERRVDGARERAAAAEAERDAAAEAWARDEEVLAIAAAPDSERVVLTSEIGALHAVWSSELGRMAVVGSDVDALDEGRTYELWFIDAGGPRSAGTFAPHDGAVRHVVDIGPADTLGVTEEPDGGSPAPTGPVLASAPLA